MFLRGNQGHELLGIEDVAEFIAGQAIEMRIICVKFSSKAARRFSSHGNGGPS